MPRESDSKRRSSTAVKFVCSYGGRILPRKSDGELRYVGGLTRVLAVDRSVSYSELMAKLAEFCGFAATLRCQLPDGDLETLVSVKSDEELANLFEEYDKKASKETSSPAPPPKIRAVLTPQAKDVTSPIPSTASSSDVSPYHSPRYSPGKSRRSRSPPEGSLSPMGFRNGVGKLHRYPCYCPGLLPPRVLCAASCCCNNCQLNSPNHPRIRTQIDY